MTLRQNEFAGRLSTISPCLENPEVRFADIDPSLASYLVRPGVNESLPLRFVTTGDAGPGKLRGTVLSGAPAIGMRLRQLPDGHEAVITAISDSGGAVVELAVDNPLPAGIGQIWMVSDQPATVGHQMAVLLFWCAGRELLPGRTYQLVSNAGRRKAVVTDIKYRVEAGSQAQIAAKTLQEGMAGVCNLSLESDLVFDPAGENPALGAFVLEDESGAVIAVGGFRFTLRRSDNITLQRLDVNKQARAGLKHQQPCVVWLTGLSGAGKSTIANILEQKLHATGRHTYLLDGDNVRHGLNKDLGFTDADRVENIRRISEVAKLMVDAGLIVITAFISPFRAERQMARDIFGEREFIEVYVNTPLAVAEQRDVKGLYKKARSGQLKNFTGIDSPYEAPKQAECEVRTDLMSAEEAAEELLERLRVLGKLGS